VYWGDEKILRQPNQIGEAHMNKFKLVLVAAVALCASIAAQAHHSFLIYDGKNYTTLKGVFTRDGFASGGHAYIEFDVTMPDGEVVTWKAESMGAGRWPEEHLEFSEVASIGDQITVTGWPLRNDRPVMFLYTMTSDETGIRLTKDTQLVPGASNFEYGENEVNPELASQLPEFTEDGERVFTEEGYLTHPGERLLEQISGLEVFDPNQVRPAMGMGMGMGMGTAVTE
jgi:hypothetical protein